MGCSSSNINTINNPPNGKRLSLEEQRRKYNKNHEIFELIMLDAEVKRDFDDGLNNNEFSHFYEQFYGRNKGKFDRYGLSYQEGKEVILENVVESQLKEDFGYREWDVINILRNLLEHQEELIDDRLEQAVVYIESFSRLFPRKQKGCVLMTECFQNVEKWGITHYLTNLKFNAGFQLQALTLALSPFLFDHILDICEVIESNPNLTTLCIILLKYDKEDEVAKTYMPEPRHLQSLSYICNAVKSHPSIKFFSFNNLFNYNYTLPRETTNSIVDLLMSDRLLAFATLNVNYDFSVCRNILRLLEGLNMLKFFLFDSKMFNDELMNEMVISLVKNKKLTGILLSTGDYLVPLEKIEEIKASNILIQFFQIVKNIKIIT